MAKWMALYRVSPKIRRTPGVQDQLADQLSLFNEVALAELKEDNNIALDLLDIIFSEIDLRLFPMGARFPEPVHRLRDAVRSLRG